MSLWRRLVARVRGGPPGGGEQQPGSPEAGSEVAASPVRAERPTKEPLVASGPPPSPLERIHATRGTRDEASTVAELLERPDELDEASRYALAEVLALRGDEAGALGLLQHAHGASALLLRADLHAARGRLAEALGAVERVLARDISAPGALERQHRWSRSLGATRITQPAAEDVTLALPTASESPFVIRRELARGGGGAVYEAEDPILLRRVALKVHHGEARARRSARHEVELAELLRGPGVVRVVDASPDEGWVAMEWAPLGSVRDRLRSGDVERLLPARAWLLPLAAVLARIHRAGWVHYDIKPANVLFASAAEVWLTDFGIARPIDAAGGGGSPGYLSPERLGGAPAAPCDDVYGYGRIVEDLLLAMGPREGLAPLQSLVALCLGPLEARPASGEILLGAAERLLGESPSGA